jgi:alpha-tubulin suppressor-like RCC1 family protein
MRHSRATSVLTVLAAATTLFVLACSSDNSTQPGTPIDVSGAYAFQEDFASQAAGVSCTAHGTVVITQTDARFSGTVDQIGTCTGPGGTVDNSGVGNFSNGRIKGTHVTFSFAGCSYSGTTQGDPADGATGTVTCTVTVQGTQIVLTGTWQVGRGAAKVTLTPDSPVLDEVDSIVLTAQVEDAAGQPVTRQLTWSSSDPAVATVDPDGKVHSVGRGIAEISAETTPVGSLELAQTGRTTARVTIRFTTISAGSRHDCGVARSGNIYCWGENTEGQLGDGSTTDSPTPVKVTGGHVFESVAVSSGLGGQPGLPGQGDHSCGIATNGRAWCWGENSSGQLGDGTTTSSSAPVRVVGSLVFQQITAGLGQTCGVTTGNAGYCWGGRYPGDGNNSGSPTPVAVSGSLAFSLLSAGGDVNTNFVCGVTTGNVGYCWGDNLNGQLGTGQNPTNPALAPTAMAGGLSLATLSAGSMHSCAVTSAGAAYCWGFNSGGRLGNGTGGGGDPPVAVSGGLSFSQIAAGKDHSCGITTQHAAYCWGEGVYGQLGNGGVLAADVPDPVSGALQFSAISAGDDHTCALTTAGDAYCWGITAAGYTSTPTPVLP